MSKTDIWLDEPIDIFGEIGGAATCYENVIHIDNTQEDGYIEDTNGEILFFNEMDEVMKGNALKILRNYE